MYEDVSLTVKLGKTRKIMDINSRFDSELQQAPLYMRIGVLAITVSVDTLALMTLIYQQVKWRLQRTTVFTNFLWL